MISLDLNKGGTGFIASQKGVGFLYLVVAQHFAPCNMLRAAQLYTSGSSCVERTQNPRQ